MDNRKIFTYVSPKTNKTAASSLCDRLPIAISPVDSIEELFPLMSNPSYNTDYVAISVDVFYEREDRLDMFDIIHTLSTLIKSTVYRPNKAAKPERRNTKIIVLVDETTDKKLIKEVLKSPDIYAAARILKKEEDVPQHIEYINKLIANECTHDPKVLNLLKTKKKETSKNGIVLTPRQHQVLKLIQERGCSNKLIARMLGISESTVKLHIGIILKKYGVKNRTQLALFSKTL